MTRKKTQKAKTHGFDRAAKFYVPRFGRVGRQDKAAEAIAFRTSRGPCWFTAPTAIPVDDPICHWPHSYPEKALVLDTQNGYR